MGRTKLTELFRQAEVRAVAQQKAAAAKKKTLQKHQSCRTLQLALALIKPSQASEVREAINGVLKQNEPESIKALKDKLSKALVENVSVAIDVLNSE